MPTYKEWQKASWDRAHQKNDMQSLTGTGIGGHLITLGAADLVTTASCVLCIGVGTGMWIREMSVRCTELWALDVSPFAVRHIEGVAGFVSDATQLPSDHFDVALSLYVAPHMNDLDLLAQLTDVVRALKPTGTFGLHYKEPLQPDALIDNRAGQADEWRVAESAGMLRHRQHMADMVHRAGGVIVAYVSEVPSERWNIKEIGIHIQKAR